MRHQSKNLNKEKEPTMQGSGRNIPDRESSKCKGPEIGWSLVRARTRVGEWSHHSQSQANAGLEPVFILHVDILFTMNLGAGGSIDFDFLKVLH